MSEIQQIVTGDVVIIGGGLGGLAAAIQLQKHGIGAQVYEQNSSLTENEGMVITLAPNAFRALSQADPGLVSKFKSEGLVDCPHTLLKENGQEVTLHFDMESKYGLPKVTLLWKDALKILADALPDECKHTGYRCCNVTEEEDGAIAHFMKGDQEIKMKAPVIVGADGLRSVVRTSLFGSIAPHDTGFSTWRALADTKVLQQPLKNVTTLGARNGLQLYVVNGPKGKFFWGLSSKEEERRSANEEEMKLKLLELFKGWELATEIVEATPAELIAERRILELPMLPQWSKGSVVLLGDAAHAISPNLGQGAGMAFEDGLELALQLSSCTNIQRALEKYAARRMPRLQKLSEVSRLPPEAVRRDEEISEWLFGYQQTVA